MSSKITRRARMTTPSRMRQGECETRLVVQPPTMGLNVAGPPRNLAQKKHVATARVPGPDHVNLGRVEAGLVKCPRK